MKRTTKAIFIFVAVCLVLSIAAAIFALYNMPPRQNTRDMIIEMSEDL
ncbi:MAG: hypothetical protein K2L99_06270 [Muribaculaceae bacterium]|nr:hypothetical protein [Muribaculaceae bacterium]MDE6286579.1 hypothetical protein [Muribaculaceae bacterium]